MPGLVSIVKTEPVYPPPPFSPEEIYPECILPGIMHLQEEGGA
jgi:hypothetical protein